MNIFADSQDSFRRFKGRCLKRSGKQNQSWRKDQLTIQTFLFNNVNLVHFSGLKNHVGLYSAPLASGALKSGLAKCKTGKGFVRFPQKKPMSLDFIREMVKFKVEESL